MFLTFSWPWLLIWGGWYKIFIIIQDLFFFLNPEINHHLCFRSTKPCVWGAFHPGTVSLLCSVCISRAFNTSNLEMLAVGALLFSLCCFNGALPHCLLSPEKLQHAWNSQHHTKGQDPLLGFAGHQQIAREPYWRAWNSSTRFRFLNILKILPWTNTNMWQIPPELYRFLMAPLQTTELPL